MSTGYQFLKSLPQGAKQSLSGALNHILEHSGIHTSEAGSEIKYQDIPEEEIKVLSAAVYQVVRNHRIRMRFHHLRRQGNNVDQACKQLKDEVNLEADYIKNIAYRK